MKKPWLEGIEIVNADDPPPVWGGWFETVALTAIVLAASFLTHPPDPFRLGGGFPWPLLAPLLAGLRYGFAYGFVSALLVLLVLGVSINQQWQAAPEFPLAWAVGIVVVAMAAGEFRDGWGRRLHRLEGAYQYRAERLEEFTRNYQLLRLSHDRLEQALAGGGLSLREGILQLQSALDAVDGLTPASLQKLIELVAEHGALTQASIVGLAGDRVDPGRVLARIGEPFDVDAGDAVLRAALDSGEPAAVNRVTESGAEHGDLLAAVPVADSTGEIHALLLIRSLPFFALHEDNLKLIAVLVAHGADHLRFGVAATSIARFVAAYERACRDHAAFRLDAVLLRLSGEPVRVRQTYERLRLSIRAVDTICLAGGAEEEEIWILLPLTDMAGARTWLQRTGDVLAAVTSELLPVDAADPRRIRALRAAP
ncbi:protein PelD [Nitrosovibrio sp. Nv17]|jgi:hypothetical protein|uniref:protein PelD n=1 Tax=Nitrosovibrio sp. Nv17 TaxID=1855339 RepID=UPI000908ED64|nr:protein PelD [Nitrosovibrio sp. Nv17]SFW32747.1 hypothetical protein SAMN05216414_11743 [Nitrosovibrio sp. Nv17]